MPVVAEALTFEQLSANAQAEALRRLGESNTGDDDWYESTIAWWEDRLKAFGFFDPRISFCGFWSQGDGASFIGAWSWISTLHGPTTVEQLNGYGKEAKGFAERLIVLVTPFKLRDFSPPCVKIIRSGYRYVHDNSVEFEFEYEEDQESDEAFEQNFIVLARDIMQQIYADLEAEYEYQSSDREYLTEQIEANNYRFDEDGAMI